jgi:hypothetical protein
METEIPQAGSPARLPVGTPYAQTVSRASRFLVGPRSLRMNQCMLRIMGGLFVSALGLLPASAMAREPKEDGIQKITARQLITAYVKNREAANKKYGDAQHPKELEVQGVVAKVEPGKFGEVALLEGEHGLHVSILLRKEDVDEVKRGETIVIRGRCRGVFEKEKIIDINGGVLVRAKEQ